MTICNQIKSHIKIIAQYLLPQHLLSRLAGRVARIRVRWFKNFFIRWFIKHYRVDMQEAVISNIDEYADFNAFFTRALKPHARPQTGDQNAIVSPVDACISQIGDINDNAMLQAKGKQYTLEALLARHEILPDFKRGKFITLYLSPRDYHRVHMPLTGKLTHMVYVPGSLFSVDSTTTNCVNNLFARNERVISIFDTAAGAMAVILVGAMIVGSVVTVWNGATSPQKQREVKVWDYGREGIILPRGAEMGHFQLGSTVIVLFQEHALSWGNDLRSDNCVRVGQMLGRYIEKEGC